jgi:hypothetical protein
MYFQMRRPLQIQAFFKTESSSPFEVPIAEQLQNSRKPVAMIGRHKMGGVRLMVT